MTKNKVKVLATSLFIALVGAMLSSVPSFTANADGDEFIKEIADYKTWTKVNKEPIKVKSTFTINGLAGAG